MNAGPIPDAPRPRKVLKTTLGALGAIALLMAGTIAYLVSTFDPRDYRDRVESLVLEKTGRTLGIQGEIGLSFWPDVAVRLGALTLSERQSSERFASVESARVRLKLRPLLAREIVASELVIVGGVVHIVRYPDGRLNIDDLFKGEGLPPSFDVERVRVERSSVDYSDQASGARYALQALNLTTGRIAPGVITPMTLSFNARDGGESFSLRIGLKGRFESDPGQQRYTLHDADVEAAGQLLSLRDIAARATTSFTARTQQKEFSLRALSLSMKAMLAQTPFTSTVDAQNVVFTPGAARADGVRAALGATDAAGSTDMRLQSESILRESDRLIAQTFAMNISANRGGYRVTGEMSAPLEVALAQREISLASLTADLRVTGARLPSDGVRAIVKGDARLDISKEGMVVRLAGKVADSNVKARVTAAGFAKPAYTFAIDLDRLDLNRYAARLAATPRKAARDVAVLTGQQLLDPLVDLPATGTLAIGLLKNGDVEAREVRLVLR